MVGAEAAQAGDTSECRGVGQFGVAVDSPRLGRYYERSLSAVPILSGFSRRMTVSAFCSFLPGATNRLVRSA